MSRQILAPGLAMTIVFTGCLLRKDQPVAEQKNLGRILDMAVKGKGVRGIADYAGIVRNLIEQALSKGLREDQLRVLADAVVNGGSEGIKQFKFTSLRKTLNEFIKINLEINQKLASKIDELPPPLKSEALRLDAMDNTDPVLFAALLKKNTGIADDKIFKRLVNTQGELLDDLAEGILTNHRLADAVGAELASDSSYGLKQLGLSTEQISSELKLSSTDTGLQTVLFTTNKSDPLVGYKIFQELSGVDVHDEAAVLKWLLQRGKDGKHVYLNFSPEDLKQLGEPFDKVFTKPIITTDPKLASEHLRAFYEAD